MPRVTELRPEAVGREVGWNQELAQMEADVRQSEALGMSNLRERIEAFRQKQAEVASMARQATLSALAARRRLKPADLVAPVWQAGHHHIARAAKADAMRGQRQLPQRHDNGAREIEGEKQREAEDGEEHKERGLPLAPHQIDDIGRIDREQQHRARLAGGGRGDGDGGL